MILGKEFVPLSKLSSAFMQPASPMHLQFAYYESSLAVRYLIQQHGAARMKKLLVDLGAGVPMHEALERNFGQAAALDADFQEYAQAKANELFSEKPDEEAEIPPRIPLAELEELVKEHPTHAKALRLLARRHTDAEKWSAALDVLNRLDKLWPADAESGGTLEGLALVYRQLERTEEERKTLERIITHSSDNLPALVRLIELARAAGQWPEVAHYAELLLAVQPLTSAGHTALAEAARHSDKPAAAAKAYQALLELEPIDPVGLHYQLAEARAELKDWESAREHLLVALEETPRYRAAQRLLVRVAAEREAARRAADQPRASLPDAEAHPPAPPLRARPDLEGKPPAPQRGSRAGRPGQ
jgi:tetratricopeptide (TPR) repeat protein